MNKILLQGNLVLTPSRLRKLMAISIMMVVHIAAQACIVTTSTSSVDVDCNGACNGSATVTPGGAATPPYTYEWNDLNSQTDSIATGLCAGTYSVTVFDNVGCSDTTTVTINEPAALTTSTSGVDASCFGACDGTATVSVGGGIGPYTYTWNDPGTQNTATAAGLCAGSYNVLVNDANGCSRSSGITVTDIAAIGIDVAAMDDSCGNGNGTATVTASGGTGAYTYLWDGGQTTQTVVGLSEGTYNVTVTDANGCNVNTDLFSAAIISSTPPISNATATATNITCNGAADGMAIANATTGITPYTYAWSDPGNQTAQTAVGLSTGTYTVTITDAFGCFMTATTSAITDPPVLTANVNSNTPPTCAGGSDGTATAGASGGTGAYT